MSLFDTVVIVDWSARSKPSPARPSKDSIWWAAASLDRVTDPVYVRTRAEAIAGLIALLRAERAADRRVLIGFDFPFGYPAGTAQVLTGAKDALTLWAWLAERIVDGPDNQNNRFTVAQEINDHFPGIGPFWGRPAHWDFPRIPVRGRARHGPDHPAERRLVERHQSNAQPVWKLYTTGSVGSQVLLGLPALQSLRLTPDLADHIQIWPFQTGLEVPEAPIVLAEIYPSLLSSLVQRQRREGEVLDATQVRVNAAAYARLDTASDLAPLFRGPASLTQAERKLICQEEAWILGTGFTGRLEAA